MNIENHLIFIKDEDKTEQIKYCKNLGTRWEVIYHNSNIVYTYKYVDITWYKAPTIINPEIHILYHHNEPISGAMKIIDFEDYIRIIFRNGYKRGRWQ